MTVPDEHTAVVRAMLTGDQATLERVLPRMRREGAATERAVGLLVKTTFVRAARRRFGPETTHGDLIRYVARARTTGLLRDEDADILIVERLLRGALGDDAAMQGMTENDTLVLGPLLNDLVHRELHLDEPAIDELLDEARQHADQLPATQ